MQSLKPFLKKIAFRYTPFVNPRYPYLIEPIQLATLINEFERLKDVEGCFCEVGVARGMTTRFLAEHIQTQKLDNKSIYYAIDTFDSFVEDDLDYEVKNRGKKIEEIRGFAYNSLKVWKRNFSKFKFINIIQADCSKFDFNTISPIKLSFLDVDLYIPTKNALPKIYDATVEGGVIIVDDVRDSWKYDGAFQAYMEFCNEKNINPTVVGNRCGIIYKN